MAYLSRVDYISNGTNRNFQVPFSAIKKEYVRVYKIGPDALNNTTEVPFTWLNENTIQLTAAVTGGWTVRIQRETFNEGALVEFTDASLVRGKHADLAVKQLLHLVQELDDNTDGKIESISVDLSGLYQGIEEARQAAQSAQGAASSAVSAAATAQSQAATASSKAASAESVANTANTNANQAKTAAEGAAQAVGTEATTRANADQNLQNQITILNQTKAGTATATQTANGLMSAADKTKLDNLSGSSGLPTGGNANDILAKDGANAAGWKTPAQVVETLPKASAAAFGVVRVDGTTIVSSGGVLTAVGGGGGGTSSHAALEGRDLPGQHPTKAINAGTEASPVGLDVKLANMDAADADLQSQINALGQGGGAIKRVTGTLTAAGWAGSAAPWTQTLTMANDVKGSAGLAAGATLAQYEAAANAGIWVSARTASNITFSAAFEKPTVNIPVEYVGA